MPDFLDSGLRKFIAENISSVEQLEVLLLVAFGGPVKSWSADDVFDVVKSSRASIAQRLEQMLASGFFELDADNRYRYKPKDEQTANHVAALQAAYKQSRVRVIEAIFSPMDPAVTFADSFRIRKEK